MKTCLDCIPCFFRQLLEGARISGASPEAQKKVLDEFAAVLPDIPFDAPPPEIARLGYNLLKKVGLNGDPYREIKRESNRLALSAYEELKNRIEISRDRLLAAVEFAIAGNIIDFGAKTKVDIGGELQKMLIGDERINPAGEKFHFQEFKRVLKSADYILYLADNAGEVVFDRLLLEEIRALYPKKHIFYAVKEKPVINDALFEDAEICGIGKYAEIISNGADAPGTVLKLCSKEFLEIYRKADIIISKGQGNFESLSGEKEPLFFLFMVKCPAVAKETECDEGEAVLLFNLKK
jgi:damage-control phosphatase, subfamily I